MADDPLFNLKIALIVCVGFATLAASLAPWMLVRWLSSQKSLDAIACASAASAGIVLGAFLAHMLPDSLESFSKYMDQQYGPDSAMQRFPFSSALAGVVLILLVSMDALIVRKGITGEEGGAGHESHDHISESLMSLAKQSGAPEQLPVTDRQHMSMGYGATGTASSTPDKHKSDSPARSLLTPVASPTVRTLAVHNPKASVKIVMTPDFEDGCDGVINDDTQSQTVPFAPHNDGLRHKRALLRAYVFFFALSLHGVFDGLSVGSEDAGSGFAGKLRRPNTLNYRLVEHHYLMQVRPQLC
jgi:zinc transporter ZupT